jgi:hypothetical protein
MKNEDKVTETTLLDCYQHVSNGGITVDLVKTVREWRSSSDEARQLVSYTLKTGLSSFGVKTETSIPLFKSSITVLEELIKVLKTEQLEDPEYLGEVHAKVVAEDGTVLHDYELGGCGQAASS